MATTKLRPGFSFRTNKGYIERRMRRDPEFAAMITAPALRHQAQMKLERALTTDPGLGVEKERARKTKRCCPGFLGSDIGKNLADGIAGLDPAPEKNNSITIPDNLIHSAEFIRRSMGL